MFIWGYHIIFNFCWIFLIDIQCLVDSVFLSQHLKYVTPLPSTCKNSSMKLAINFSEYPLNMMNSFSFTALKIFSLAFAILATKELDVDIFEFMFLGINFIGYIDYTVIKYEQFQSLCFQIFLLPISLLSFCYYYLGIYYYTWWHARDLLISVHFSSFLLTGETIQLAFTVHRFSLLPPQSSVELSKEFWISITELFNSRISFRSLLISPYLYSVCWVILF